VSAFTSWVDQAHSLGGVATVWPFSTGPYASNYGQPAARFPADVFASLADAGTLPMTDGVQFNNPGTWVYVLATSMTGSSAVNDAATQLVDPTQAELEQACAANGDCPTDWQGLLKELVIGTGVLVGAIVLSKLG
jgi:hypothetical protein